MALPEAGSPDARMERPALLEGLALMERLETVFDPCSLSMGRPMSICEMGLVETLTCEDGVVSVVLCLTEPGCVNYGKIRQYVTDALLQSPDVKSVAVSLSTTQLWSPERVGTRGEPGVA
jgi:metal-sulfur cluster biosynthetic enzyme